MNLHLSGHHLEVTDSMRDYITGKLDRVKRHFDHVIDVNMILSVDKLVQKVEANVHLSGKNIFVESQDGDMYAAILGKFFHDRWQYPTVISQGEANRLCTVFRIRTDGRMRIWNVRATPTKASGNPTSASSSANIHLRL